MLKSNIFKSYFKNKSNIAVIILLAVVTILEHMSGCKTCIFCPSGGMMGQHIKEH
ncbi:hypothetical protein ES707_07751 [subsurface metagenome]